MGDHLHLHVCQTVFLEKPLEELGSCLKGALFTCFDLGIRQVTANSKPMCASFEVLATICISKLTPATEDLISFFLRFVGEPLVKRAGVD